MYLIISFCENSNDFANSMYFFSVFSKPVVIAVTIIGNAIKTETKTGTEFEVNQKYATKINATTGVARTIDNGISRKSFTKPEIPHRKPKNVPRKTVIINEAITRKNVNAKFCQNNRLLQI